MPQPTRSSIHIDSALTNISVAFSQASNFIAGRIVPTVRVQKQSDKFFTYPQKDWFRTEADVRGPDGLAKVHGYSQSTGNYFCEVIALAGRVADQDRRNADSPLDLDADTTRFLTEQILLKRELQFISAIMASGSWSNSTTPSTTWDDVTSTPIEDVRARYNVMVENTGMRPNVLILGAETFEELQDHPDIVDRIKYGATPGSPAVVTPQAMAALFGVDRVEIIWGMQNTAAEQATASQDFLGNSGKDALLAFMNPNPGLRTASAAYRFEWEALNVVRLRDELARADHIEIQEAYDFKVISNVLGEYFSGAVA